MADGTLKVGTITTSSGSGTITLGQSGETLALGSGVTSQFNQPAFEAYLSSDQTGITDNVNTKVQFDIERFDTNNAYDNSTNYRFQPTIAGKYYCYANVKLEPTTSQTTAAQFLSIMKNGVEYNRSDYDPPDNEDSGVAMYTFSVLELNGSSDYVEIFGRINVTSGTFKFDIGNGTSTYFGAYRIGA